MPHLSRGMRSSRLLAALDPHLHVERYSFTAASEPALQGADFAVVRRNTDGLNSDPFRSPAGEWARISLGVHSSLEAVGLTAALSTRLADAGISANVIAALRRDHFFVPWDRRDEALAVLRG